MADRLAELVDVRVASAGVALVTLNLPQARNAMTTELTAARPAASTVLPPSTATNRVHRAERQAA